MVKSGFRFKNVWKCNNETHSVQLIHINNFFLSGERSLGRRGKKFGEARQVATPVGGFLSHQYTGCSDEVYVYIHLV